MSEASYEMDWEAMDDVLDDGCSELAESWGAAHWHLRDRRQPQYAVSYVEMNKALRTLWRNSGKTHWSLYGQATDPVQCVWDMSDDDDLLSFMRGADGLPMSRATLNHHLLYALGVRNITVLEVTKRFVIIQCL